MNKKAFTLLEIIIACLILSFAIIPLVNSSKSDAAKAIETEKIQMAERILESIKSELMTMKFSIWYDRAEAENLNKDAVGPFPLNDAYYTSSINDVLKVQQKYKDFSVVGTWSWAIGSDKKPDKTMVNAEISCFFTNPGKGIAPIERKKAFLIVKP